jgi:hypothetical protein
VDTVAYVGDQLSFYLDYNINETFLDTAYQYNNIIRHGRIMGYKFGGRPSTYGQVALFILIPASSTGLGPDTDYIPVLKRGTTFSSLNGLKFVLTQNVDFSKQTNPVVVATVDDTTGAPTNYAIKAYGNVVSGQFGQTTITVGEYQRFLKLKMPVNGVSEIISVVDSEGNEYYEVDYLAQDMVIKEVTNPNFRNDNVASILKPLLVSRKFVVEQTKNDTFLQFGSGKSGATDVVAQPQRVAMDIFGKDYVTSTTFDPTRLSQNQNFGIVPSNTTLTITYRATNLVNSNAGVGAINATDTPLMSFPNEQNLAATTLTSILNSLEVSNEEPIVGDVTYPDSTELKQRIYDTFPTQNRAVTQADYENVAYRLPVQYGSIKRCLVTKDQNSLKRNLNMYVISEDEFGKLTKTNSTIKNNLKTWLNQFRMINDTVDILDPFIVNMGIEFIVKPATSTDKFALLNRCIKALTDKYQTSFFIGEPFYISDVYSELKKVTGVLDVEKVKLVNKAGGNYASAQLNINKNMSPDGSYLVTPYNAILEIKFPSVDIKGKVR